MPNFTSEIIDVVEWAVNQRQFREDKRMQFKTNTHANRKGEKTQIAPIRMIFLHFLQVWNRKGSLCSRLAEDRGHSD